MASSDSPSLSIFKQDLQGQKKYTKTKLQPSRANGNWKWNNALVRIKPHGWEVSVWVFFVRFGGVGGGREEEVKMKGCTTGGEARGSRERCMNYKGVSGEKNTGGSATTSSLSPFHPCISLYTCTPKFSKYQIAWVPNCLQTDSAAENYSKTWRICRQNYYYCSTIVFQTLILQKVLLCSWQNIIRVRKSTLHVTSN